MSSRDYDFDVQPVLLGAWTHRGEPSKLAKDGDLCQLIALVDRPRVVRTTFRPAPSRLNTPISAVRLRFSVNGDTIDEAMLDISLERGEDVEVAVEPVTAASVDHAKWKERYDAEKAEEWAALADAMGKLPKSLEIVEHSDPDKTVTYVPKTD